MATSDYLYGAENIMIYINFWTLDFIRVSILNQLTFIFYLIKIIKINCL